MKLLIIPETANDTNARNLIKIADFLGLERVEQPPNSSDFAVVVSQDSLGVLTNLPPAGAVLVYACNRDCDNFRVGRARGDSYYIERVEGITRQLSCLSIHGPRSDFSFMPSAVNNTRTLIRLDNDPFLILQKQGGSDWFFLAAREVVDLDRPINVEKFSVDKIFPGIIPFVMFFQYIQDVRRRHYANLMIDDPGLLHRYGFVNYKQMADLIHNNDFAVTIAFIPWNYRKSQLETVNLFRANQDRLSICVHGCDHTAAEFAGIDEAKLNWKVSLARKRMEEHKKKLMLPYDNVMVFPQGAFSEESMRVLQQHGFAAAVNSTLIARNHRGGFKIRDMISPATTHYGMPLFLRRPPRRIEDFAYDLFFGRPALIVQHSLDFAEGWGGALSFIGKLRELEPALQWMPLGRIVEKLCPPSRAAGDRVNSLQSQGIHGYTLTSWFKAALRRSLCEIRDRVVHRNKYLRGGPASWLGSQIRRIEGCGKKPWLPQ